MAFGYGIFNIYRELFMHPITPPWLVLLLLSFLGLQAHRVVGFESVDADEQGFVGLLADEILVVE